MRFFRASAELLLLRRLGLGISSKNGASAKRGAEKQCNKWYREFHEFLPMAWPVSYRLDKSTPANPSRKIEVACETGLSGPT